MVDVLIVGGSTAGLSAALVLARCRRSVLVCDAQQPRNRFSRHMHGFLSREGISPEEFLKISRQQVMNFPSVRFQEGFVTSIERGEGSFSAVLDERSPVRSRSVLLATGIVDELPDISGFAALYGTSIHHCPYCDAWEHRDQPIAVYGKHEPDITLVEEMRLWSSDIIFCSDGNLLGPTAGQKLRALGIEIIGQKIDSLIGQDGQLEKIVFSNGRELPRKAMFFVSPQRQNNDLARQLGCEFDRERFVACFEDVKTGVPGVFAAGNTAGGLQLAIVAAAEGAKAAHAINAYLLEKRGI